MESQQTSRQTIYSELIPIFHQVFDDDTLRIDDATTAHDVEQWDSLNHIQLVVAVEKKFQIRFKVAEITSWPTVGAFVDSIQAKLNAR